MQIVLIVFGWLFKMTSLTKIGIKGVGKNHLLIVRAFFEMTGICGVWWREKQKEYIVDDLKYPHVSARTEYSIISSCQLTFLF